jgi:hypothetical protein
VPELAELREPELFFEFVLSGKNDLREFFGRSWVWLVKQGV